MKTLPFKSSSMLSLGVELELQIIDPMTYDLISHAKDLIRNIKTSPYANTIKPEITQSMIEINSSIHQSTATLYDELVSMRTFLLSQAEKIGIRFSGGGTHPFDLWTAQKIFPTKRFKNLSRHYRYLSKRSTVFGQHVHVGCSSAEDALYLTHALSRYVPQLIAISAASPFYQGVDTGYHSSRSNVFNAFPLSGVIPYLINWQDFSRYFYKMRKLDIVSTMKDFYWDIRPKPEFGTVEIRVCDTPLTIKKAVMIAAYIQSLSQYLLQEKPFEISNDFYYLYNYNRFQAGRYGYEGDFVDPITLQHGSIYDDLLATLKIIKKNIKSLNNFDFVSQLSSEILKKRNDASFLRQREKEGNSLQQVVHEQCDLWAADEG